MIPKFFPDFSFEEVKTFFHSKNNYVEIFEREFSQKFHVNHSIAFPYGRSALWAFLKCLKIENKEIVLPAYTCSVIANAIILSGNIPIFVDINLSDFNMNLEKFAEAINYQTAVVIPTHLFGNPMDVYEVERIIKLNEKKFDHKIWVIQDCAHSFNAKWKGKSVIHFGDAALFGLGVSKIISSIFGGMITIQDQELANLIRLFRENNFRNPSQVKSIKRFIYLSSFIVSFQKEFFGLTYFLQEETPLLNKLSKAYHLDHKIHFPPDFLDQMMNCEAGVGIMQLAKYEKNIKRRQEIFNIYMEKIRTKRNWILPVILNGATHSHFPIIVDDKDKIIAQMVKKRVQLGEVIDYSLPHLNIFQKYFKNK